MGCVTSTSTADRRRDQRDEFWRSIGHLGSHVDPVSDAGEGELWPAGRADYLRVATEYTGLVATDGLSDPREDAPVGRGIEIYVEGRELLAEEIPPEAGWLLGALEEVAGAVAGAGPSLRSALGQHDVLSLEVSGAGAPADWVSGGRLGVLLGVPLPGRRDGFETDTGRVAVLSVVPLRPSELAVVVGEGPAGRRRLVEALAAAGWHSYAETSRPAVL